jgi:CRP/FNR family transcriptional regulator, cyclic AMP receptor protein
MSGSFSGVAPDLFGRHRHRPQSTHRASGRPFSSEADIWPVPGGAGRYRSAVSDSPYALAPDLQAALTGLGIVRRHRRGAFLILEGDRSDHVLFIRSGRLRIVRTSTDGRDVLVAVRGPGELVGELSALAGADETRAASVVALDDVVVQAIPSADFLRFLDQNRDVSFGLLRQLAARLREATSRHADAAGYDVLHRVARALVDEADRHGHAVEGGTAVGAGLSQDDLAGLVAASPKSVGRSLAVLRSRGLVSTSRRSIVISDLDGLRQFGG